MSALDGFTPAEIAEALRELGWLVIAPEDPSDYADGWRDGYEAARDEAELDELDDDEPPRPIVDVIASL
jgi:hypothetical protein